MPRYCRILHEMYDMAGVYTTEQNFERAFILYLRFVGTVVEELPKHRDYQSFTPDEKDRFDRQTIHAMNTAEFLKRKIKTLYEEEAITKKSELAQLEHEKRKNGNVSTPKPPPISPPIIDRNLKSYVVCKKQSGYTLLFQRIIIPNDLPHKFLTTFESLPDTNRFAVLYGKLVRNSLIVSQAIITDGTETSLEKIDRSISVPDQDEENELLIIGCICGDLSDHSVDYFISRSLLTEIVIVVCRPGDNQTYVLHLSNLSDRKELGKPKSESQPEFKDAASGVCGHTHITEQISCTFVDLRDPTPRSTPRNS
uniref:USP8 dimerisation domain-containing protein n=1 Tax=Acrobeloides nanus TaxID=290746 RepID=A0A914C2M6_9BILA